MNLISNLEEYIGNNERKDLPEDVLLFFSRHTPIINVDLLIKNNYNEILLVWRDDKEVGVGWHIPGGIIRYKETMIERIVKTCFSEIGCNMIHIEKKPLDISEIILDKNNRAHFISILYECSLPPDCITTKHNLKWHLYCPDELLDCQKIYKKYFKQ